MSGEVIPLSKKYTEKCFDGRAWLVFEKFDGVPIRIDLSYGEGNELEATAQTRPGKKAASSVDHIVEYVKLQFGNLAPCVIVGEVVHRTVFEFKDVSGMVRKDTPNPELYMQVFDFYAPGHTHYYHRMTYPHQLLKEPDGAARMPFCAAADSVEEYRAVQYEIRKKSSTPEQWFEGFILRDRNCLFEPAKRQPGYLKDVIEPTVDLSIVGWLEAVSQDGSPLGMVGGLIADYKGKRIGIGPGKMTHPERKALFEEYAYKQVGLPDKPNQEWFSWARDGEPGFSRIAEIKHKRDPSYTALRQPTFQWWRDDKKEPSYE
ncbi:hypothetical protein HOR19_gp23 [Phage MedPE-SWcel-C56]|uniref:DNA ligase n=1 Tax=Phage MedPE-SWcel-C56 TaxID=1871314 RepID=A0A1B1IY15_9CAUD|nr:hypothetical protein HOR19_gp23 [Phage MedPE-SWcel-C56]ANS06216.1 hypothetical protein [Phage MedPE-SWcel-C56]